MRTRLAILPAILAVIAMTVALTACSSGGGPGKARSLGETAGPTDVPATTTAPATLSTSSAAVVPGATTAVSSAESTATPIPVKPLTTVAPGKPAASRATEPGTYSYDSSGTVTLGSPGTPQNTTGTATLTVSPIRGDLQHSALHSDSTGDTEQDVLVRDAGSYGASLRLTSPAFNKEFRPSPAVLLVPDPARVGSAWSWSGISTDGKTTVSASNKVSRQETVVIGGQKVPCAVLQTHLVLGGDVDYVADITTWWAPAYRLPVKNHTIAKGSYNGFPFSADITATMRSAKPS